MHRSPSEFDNSPWRAITSEQLAAAAHVPTMLAHEECQLYYWLTNQWARDIGAVVELGSYVGGSTARLAAGLADAGREAEVHAYDLFKSSEPLKERLLYAHGIAPFEGQNILHLSIELLEPWTDRIELHPGRIETQDWDDGPIEILVMDASKKVSTMDVMSTTFFPHLIPGQSLVVQQDYYHWRLPWIAAQMERLKDWFTPVAYCPNDTMVFLNTRQIDQEALDLARLRGTSDEALKELLDRAHHAAKPWGQEHRILAMKGVVDASPNLRHGVKMRQPSLVAEGTVESTVEGTATETSAPTPKDVSKDAPEI